MVSVGAGARLSFPDIGLDHTDIEEGGKVGGLDRSLIGIFPWRGKEIDRRTLLWRDFDNHDGQGAGIVSQRNASALEIVLRKLVERFKLLREFILGWIIEDRPHQAKEGRRIQKYPVIRRHQDRDFAQCSRKIGQRDRHLDVAIIGVDVGPTMRT